jgi:dCTP deaminase
MIKPFLGSLVREEHKKKVISYGLSSFGYDARLSPNFKIPRVGLLDPKDMSELHFESFYIADEQGYYDIPPHGFVLGSTVEYFRIPLHVVAICLGKSTYARLGLVVNVTPLEPGWEGNVTLELSNTTDSTIRVYCNEGIAQFMFFEGEFPEVDYAMRKGKYQGQTGVTLAKV